MDHSWARKMEERLDAQNAELLRLRQLTNSSMPRAADDYGHQAQRSGPQYYRSDDPQTYGPPIPAMQRIMASTSPLSHRAPPHLQPRQQLDDERRRLEQLASLHQQKHAASALAAQAEEKRQLLSQLHTERTRVKNLEAEAAGHCVVVDRLQQRLGSLTQDLAALTESNNRLRQRLAEKEQVAEEEARIRSARETTVWGNITAMRGSFGGYMQAIDSHHIGPSAVSPSKKRSVNMRSVAVASDSIIIGSDTTPRPLKHGHSTGTKRERDDFDGASMTLGIMDEEPPQKNLSLVRVLPPQETPSKGRRTAAAPRKPSVTHAERARVGVMQIPASPLPKPPNARTRTVLDPPHSAHNSTSNNKVSNAATSFSASFSRQGAGPISRAPPTRSPSPNNPKRGPLIERRFVLSGFTAAEMVDIEKAVSKLASMNEKQSQAVILQSDRDGDLPPECTHVLIPGIPTNFKALCGLVSERWIINPTYIFSSLEAGFWLDEREANHLHYTPSPLAHHRFAIQMPDRTAEERDMRERIRKIIELGKGTVVHSAAHDGVIVINSGRDILNFCMK